MSAPTESPPPATRRSPIHALLQDAGARWQECHDGLLARSFAAVEQEQRQTRDLALADLSPFPRWGLKGEAEPIWTAAGIDSPSTVYDTRRLPEGTRIARLAEDEWLLEAEWDSTRLEQMRGAAAEHPEVFCYRRQDAAFAVVGARVPDVFAQVCGVDIRKEPPGRILLTRVAGVNAAILPEWFDEAADVCIYRLWIDCSFAVYLWGQLQAILCEHLGGAIVGAECIIPSPSAGQPTRPVG